MVLLRAVLLSAFVTLALAYAYYPVSRAKRSTEESDSLGDDDDWSEGTGARSFTSPFGFPFSYPHGSFLNPWWPSFSFLYPPVIVPWYKGPNVCVETRYDDKVDSFNELLKDWAADYKVHEQSSHQTCRGNEKYYICYGTKMVDGVMKKFARKYQCCHGFVRKREGPGCVESKNGKESPEKNPGHEIDTSSYSEQQHYSYVKTEGSESP